MDDTRSAPRADAVSRRTVLRLGGAALAGAATGPFVFTPARAQGFNWKRFQGKELFFLFYKHPWVDEMVKHIPEFESMTGMKVQYEVLPEVQGRQKLVVEMTGGSGGVDGFHSSTHVEKRRFWKSGWYHPINKFLEDATLTPPDFDWNDILPGAKLAVQQPDKTISGIPTFVDPFVLFYRKDLYDQKGWKAPKTLAEMESQAKGLHAAPNMYGIVYRGLKNANATPWAYMLFAMGGDYLKDGKSAINTPEWTKTMDLYAGMLRQYGPPGVVNFNWYECSAAFMQGQVGIYFDGVNFANQFEDPDEVEDRREGRLRRPAVGPRRPPHLHVHERDGRLLPEQEQGGGVPLLLLVHQQAERGARAPRRRGRRARLGLDERRGQGQAQDAAELVRRVPRLAQDREARPPRDRGRHRVPRHHRRRDPEGDRGHPLGAGAGGRPQGLPGPPEPNGRLAIRVC